MNETKTIGIGVIGCGFRMRTVMSHLPDLGERFEVRALCDPDPLSISEARASFAPAAREIADYRELVAADDVDWVFIGSYNALHVEHAVAALDAGKHVFCEKPLATTVEDCLRMKRASAGSDRIFSLGLVLRYTPHYQAIHEVVASGRLGQILSLEFNETLTLDHGGHIHGNNWRRYSSKGGGHMLEKCCHDMDIICWLLGARPVQVASFGGCDFFQPGNSHHRERVGAAPNGLPPFLGSDIRTDSDPFRDDKDVVDNQVAILRFDNGVRATFHTNCITAIPERRIYVCGTEGTLRADLINRTLEFQAVGYGTQRDSRHTGGQGGHGGGDAVLGRDLASCMLHGTPPRAGIAEGITSTIACLAVDQARHEGRIVDLTDLWRELDAIETPETASVS